MTSKAAQLSTEMCNKMHLFSFETAKKCFTDALNEIQHSDSRRLEENWEPLFNNLGHVYRKLGKLPEALQFHQQALSLQPLNGSTYAAIGLVHMMMNNLLEAIEAFHEALGLKPDDSFSTTMLSYAMEGLTMSPADGLGQPFEGWLEITQLQCSSCLKFV